MLRTLLFVMMVVWLVLASAIAFVPIVAGQEGAAGSLTAACDRDSVPRGSDTLLRCHYTATNNSGRDWSNAGLTYVPASEVAIPDRYFFFRYFRDGGEQPHDPASTTYSFGRIPAGGSSLIALDVIVRSERDFGADVVLTDDGGATVNRVGQRWQVEGGGTDPPLSGSLVPLRRDESGGASPSDASFVLIVRNALASELGLVTAEVFAPDYGVTLGLDDPQRASITTIRGGLGAVAGGGFVQRELRIETRGRCAHARPAIILIAASSDGVALSAAILPDDAVSLNCQTLETPSFPAAGQGPMPEGAATPLRPLPLPLPLPLAIATSGAVIALLGAVPLIGRLRRRR